VAEGSALEMR